MGPAGSKVSRAAGWWRRRRWTQCCASTQYPSLPPPAAALEPASLDALQWYKVHQLTLLHFGWRPVCQAGNEAGRTREHAAPHHHSPSSRSSASSSARMSSAISSMLSASITRMLPCASRTTLRTSSSACGNRGAPKGSGSVSQAHSDKSRLLKNAQTLLPRLLEVAGSRAGAAGAAAGDLPICCKQSSSRVMGCTPAAPQTLDPLLS